VLLPSRWAACILVYLGAALLMLAPHLPLAYWNPAEPDAPILTFLCQSLYLAPTEGLRELAFPQEFWRSHPPMTFGPGGRIWLVTSAIYLLIGVTGFAVAVGQIRQFALRLEGTGEGGGK
jgi:hypothetical protein